MKERRILLATRPPLASPWQVAIPVDGLPLLLLGWRVAPELELEGGMPGSVGELLSDALSSVGVLTFPMSVEPSAAPRTKIQLLKANGLGERLRSVLSHTPAKIWLVTTQEPSAACQLFDDPGFPWWMQGQIVLLSSTDSVLEMDREVLLKLMDPMRPVERSDLATRSLKAIIQPGVDGDVAAIVSVDAETDAEIVAAIEASCREAAFEWQMVPESQFAEVLSDSATAVLGTA